MKCILLVRVSTEQQSFDKQKDEILKLALADGYALADIEDISIKESGIKLAEEERLGLIEMKKKIETGEYDCVYAWEISRIARTKKVLFSIADYLEQQKVQLIIKNPYLKMLKADGTRDESASMIFTIFAQIAESEMRLKKERFRRGREKLAEEGRYNGGKIPFGYRIDYNNAKKIVIDENDAAVVREVFNLYESGISQPQLAREFHRRGNSKLTISFINNILNNERYTGSKKCYAGSSFQRSYPVIITPAQFKHCREIALGNNTTAGKAKNIYFASKILVCPLCGCYFSASGSKVYYRCYDANNPMRDYNHYKTPRCTNNVNISINIMDSLLWHVAIEAEVKYILNAAEEDKVKYEKQIAELEIKLNAIDQRLEDLDKKKGRVGDALIAGFYTQERADKKKKEFDELGKIILQDQADYIRSIEHTKSLLKDIGVAYNLTNVDSVVDYIEHEISLRNKIENLEDDAERSKIIHRHIKKVVINNDEVQYKFGIGEKMAKSRFITIEFYNGDIQFYQYIPNTGTGGYIFKATSTGELIEKISFTYLHRYYDIKKRERQELNKKKVLEERFKFYPTEKYAVGLRELSEFLHCSLSTGRRWIEELEILKPAVVCKYRKQLVIDKQLCKNILAKEANKNYWARKLFNSINYE